MIIRKNSAIQRPTSSMGSYNSAQKVKKHETSPLNDYDSTYIPTGTMTEKKKQPS